jgi:hypothetical protein
MSLKDLTKDNHTNAERQEFVKILFSGSIDPKLYATYLYNQFPMYELLEVCAMPHGLLSDIPGILRAKAIRTDFDELWGDEEENRPKLCAVVKEYMDFAKKYDIGMVTQTPDGMYLVRKKNGEQLMPGLQQIFWAQYANRPDMQKFYKEKAFVERTPP